MSLATHKTASGFLLPSIHSAPPFFTSECLCEHGCWALTSNFYREQPNPATQSIATEQWTHLILAYARHRRLFYIHVEDAETTGNDWDEVLRNERINRKVLPSHLAHILETMVAQNVAAYEPAKQTRAVLLYWKLPEEWAEALHSWATSTGQLNTILTFYDITDPPIESELSSIPVSLLRKAISILGKTGRAQLIGAADGEGVRIFAGGR